MTPRQLFKAEVLAAMAERGHSPAQCATLLKAANVQLDKQAFLGKMLGEGIEGVSRLGSAALPIAAVLGAGIPVGAGLVGGHLLAKAQDDDTDVDAIRSEELIQAYRQLAEDAARKARFRGLRPAGVV